MKEEITTTEKLIEVLAREKQKFAKIGSLTEVYSKFSKIGIDTKSTYSLPLKDTIGKTFQEQIQFKNL